jgi:hypothetical protein
LWTVLAGREKMEVFVEQIWSWSRYKDVCELDLQQHVEEKKSTSRRKIVVFVEWVFVEE